MSIHQEELLPDDERSDDVGDEEDLGASGLAGKRLQVIRDVEERFVFRFEFGPAILAQVREKLEALPQIPFVTAPGAMPNYPGFYQLFRNGVSVYVGRTIRPISARLREHTKKLRGRIAFEEMTVKYLFVEDLSLVALSEDSMINYFGPLGLDPWGTMGFGSKVPGYGRAGQSSEWDAGFPPNLAYPITAQTGRAGSLRELVESVARSSPITLSIPRRFRAAFDAAHRAPVHVRAEERSFEEWMNFIEEKLAPGWKVRREPVSWYIVSD